VLLVSVEVEEMQLGTLSVAYLVKIMAKIRAQDKSVSLSVAVGVSGFQDRPILTFWVMVYV